MVKNFVVENEANISIDKRAVHGIVAELKKQLNFSISFLQINFVSSQYIKEINEEYLSHEGSTDIITFNYSGENDNLDGECFISINDAKENADRFNVNHQNELIRLIAHGLLHLLGYDDIDEGDRKIMKQKENQLVEHFTDFKTKIFLGYDQ